MKTIKIPMTRQELVDIVADLRSKKKHLTADEKESLSKLELALDTFDVTPAAKDEK